MLLHFENYSHEHRETLHNYSIEEPNFWKKSSALFHKDSDGSNLTALQSVSKKIEEILLRIKQIKTEEFAHEVYDKDAETLYDHFWDLDRTTKDFISVIKGRKVYFPSELHQTSSAAAKETTSSESPPTQKIPASLSLAEVGDKEEKAPPSLEGSKKHSLWEESPSPLSPTDVGDKDKEAKNQDVSVKFSNCSPEHQSFLNACSEDLEDLEEVSVDLPAREFSEEPKSDSEVEEEMGGVLSSQSESEAEESAMPVRRRRTADGEIVGQRNAILADWLRTQDRVDYSKYF